jgi:putative ABC transport system substrate-binding protein
MNRRDLLLTALAGALVAPAAVTAQPATKVHRIGVLEEAPANPAHLAAFRQGLAGHGYTEGRDFVIESRAADDRPERLPDLGVELAGLGVDVFVTSGDAAALAAQRAAKNVPVVMATSADPAGAGVGPSLSRPRGNVTGLHFWGAPELGGARLRLLRELVPGLSRVAIVWNSGNLHTHMVLRDTERAASALGVTLQRHDVTRPWDLERVFEAILQDKADALLPVEDQITIAERTRVVAFAALSRLPAVYGLRDFVEAGGLLGYGTDRRDLFRRAAGYVHRILTGARPAELPVEPPRVFELVVNLRTARAQGLTIPPAMLARAQQVLE